MSHPTIRRVLPAALAGFGLAATLAGCGNSSNETPTLDPSATASSLSAKPGQTKALRTACVSVNNKIVATNDTWNSAVDSRKAEDMKKAVNSMTSLSKTLREQGDSSGNPAFKQKAYSVAAKVDALKASDKPAKTVDTATYNDAVDDITAYCAEMFPQRPGSSL